MSAPDKPESKELDPKDDDNKYWKDYWKSVKGNLDVIASSPSLSSGKRQFDKDETEGNEIFPILFGIKERTNSIDNNHYTDFIDAIFNTDEHYYPDPFFHPSESAPNPQCKAKIIEDRLKRKANALHDPLAGVSSYDLLKQATEVFLVLECGLRVDGPIEKSEDPETGNAPTRADGKLLEKEKDRRFAGRNITYQEVRVLLDGLFGAGKIHDIIDTIIKMELSNEPRARTFLCKGLLTTSTRCMCMIELLWSYWHEEAMLSQTMNAISMRFQNKRSRQNGDPLAELEIDPLRPLSNILWGYIQDEQNRLTVKRRAYEYSHQYGLTLYGKAIPLFRPADNRSKFIEAFHNLLYICSRFFIQDDNQMVEADALPVLNALKEVNLLLAEGMHNQFRSLTWNARVEMLMEQWILSRPEMRRFLSGRIMIPYSERWMNCVDAMKKLQGWTDASVMHFNELAKFGERILLSVRYLNWNSYSEHPEYAKLWARYYRPEIQSYIHAYRTVTGADLTSEPVDSCIPAALLRRRLAEQRRAG